MLSYKYTGDIIRIEGRKFDRLGNEAIGAYVVLYNVNSSEPIGRTTVIQDGYWNLELDSSSVPSGKYYIQFRGSNLIQDLPPYGDWELLDILDPNFYNPIEPADVYGLLKVTVTIIDSNTVQFNYAVPINATTIAVTNTGLTTVSGVNLTLIQQHKDPHISTEYFDPAYDLTSSDWTATPTSPVDLESNKTVTFDVATPISAAYKVKLTGNNLGAAGIRVHIVTREAADIIDAGRLRVERGISISLDGVQGTLIDATGLITAADFTADPSTYAVRLYNTPQTLDGIADSYARIAGWVSSTDRFVRSVSDGAKIELAATSTPYISVGLNSSGRDVYTEYARMGWLASGYAGLWGNVGGFGGTEYSDAPLKLDSRGMYYNDGTWDRLLIGKYLNDQWTTPSGSSITVLNPGFENWTLGAPDDWYTESSDGTVSQSSGSYKHSGNYAVNLQVDTDVAESYALVSQEISGITMSTAYQVTFYYMTDSDIFIVPTEIKIYQWDGVSDWVLLGSTEVSNSSWSYKSFSFNSSSDPQYGSENIKIEFSVTGSGQIIGMYNAYIDDVSFTKWEHFSDLTTKGLYIFNSPDDYIKIGKGVAEIRSQNVTMNNLTVYGELRIEGNYVQSGPTLVVSPFQVLNVDATMPAYAGLEVDSTNQGTTLLYYDRDAYRWFLGRRTHGARGTQSVPTSNQFIMTGDKINHYMDLEFMKLSFVNISWAQFAVYDDFHNEDKRKPGDTGGARVWLEALDNGNNDNIGTADASVSFTSKTYSNITTLFSAAGSVTSASGFTPTVNPAWFTDQMKNLIATTSPGNEWNGVTTLSNDGTTVYGPATLSTDTSITIKTSNPTYSVANCTYLDSTNGGFGYVKMEVSYDNGSNYQTYLDTFNNINLLGGYTEIDFPGIDYIVRITLKNDGSGRGSYVYRFLVATDPSPWTW